MSDSNPVLQPPTQTPNERKKIWDENITLAIKNWALLTDWERQFINNIRTWEHIPKSPTAIPKRQADEDLQSSY